MKTINIAEQENNFDARQKAATALNRFSEEVTCEYFPVATGFYVRWKQTPDVIFHTDEAMEDIIGLPTLQEWNLCSEGIKVQSMSSPELLERLMGEIEKYDRAQMRKDAQEIVHAHINEGGNPEAFLTMYRGEYQVCYRPDMANAEEIICFLYALDSRSDQAQAHHADTFTFTLTA